MSAPTSKGEAGSVRDLRGARGAGEGPGDTIAAGQGAGSAGCVRGEARADAIGSGGDAGGACEQVDAVGWVYAVHRADGSVAYVGQTVRPVAARLRGHRAEVASGSSSPFHSWLREQAADPPIVVLEECALDALDGREAFWIRQHPEALNVRTTPHRPEVRAERAARRVQRGEMAMFRATTEDRDEFYAAAESLGMSFSTWARMTLLKEARKLRRSDGEG